MLEIDGGNALVQLFEASAGINLESSKVRFLGRSMELGVSEDMPQPHVRRSGPSHRRGVRKYCRRSGMNINGLPHESGRQKLSPGIYTDGNFRH